MSGNIMDKDKAIYQVIIFCLYYTTMMVLYQIYGIEIPILFGLATLIMNTSD